jgi:hypothetical protein
MSTRSPRSGLPDVPAAGFNRRIEDWRTGNRLTEPGRRRTRDFEYRGDAVPRVREGGLRAVVAAKHSPVSIFMILHHLEA